MQIEKKLILRKKFSHIITGALLLLVSFVCLYAELFKEPLPEFDTNKLNSNPLKLMLIEGINQIKISNKNGQFTLIRDIGYSDSNLDGIDDESKSPTWLLEAPVLSALRPDAIKHIIYSLQNISIKKQFSYDEINLTHLNLKEPLATIEVVSEKNKKAIIGIGLINNDDKSQFISVVSEKNDIFQINLQNFSLENFSLNNLIDPLVFLGLNNNLEIIEIYKGRNLDTDPNIALIKKDQFWYDQLFNKLNDKTTKSFLQKLFFTKTQIVLDQISEKLQVELNSLYENPAFTIIIKHKNNNGISYSVSDVVSNLSDIKLEEKSVIIWASNRPFPLVVKKDILNTLNIKPNEFRASGFNKIFN